MTESTDLFMQPQRGGGIKPEALEGKLVLFRPSVLGKGPKYGAPGETVDRITTDVVVFADDGTVEEKGSDVYYSQTSFVTSLRAALKPGALPYVLGRVRKYPSKASVSKGWDTPEKLAEAEADWLKKGGKGDRPGFAWSIGEFSPEDAVIARRYLESTNPFGPPAE